MIGRRKRTIAVTRDKLEEVAFLNRAEITIDHARNIATTRIDGVLFWADLDAGEIW
jgi:hypothetical protein